MLARSEALAIEAHVARPMRLVMIEDDLTLQEVVREFLDDAEVCCFRSGPEALEHCRTSDVDAVLLDINLHGPWDGWRVLEEFRALETAPPVILTTGVIEVTADGIDYPQLELLPKPFRLGELEQALGRVSTAAIDDESPIDSASPCS